MRLFGRSVVTLDEALEVAKWERVSAPHMQPGCYVVWDVPTQRYRRQWPNGDGCWFIPDDADRAAMWAKLDAGWSS